MMIQEKRIPSTKIKSKIRKQQKRVKEYGINSVESESILIREFFNSECICQLEVISSIK